MHLGDLTRPDLIFPALAGSDRPTVLRALAEKLAATSVTDDPDKLYSRLWEREQLGSTAIGSGVAIPHCKMDGIEQVVVAIGFSPKGVDFEAEDGELVRLLFLVLSPDHAPAAHLQSLSAISKWVKTDRHVKDLLKIEDTQAIFEALQQEEV